ncbi:MAG: glycosyltransferase family 4 protein [Dehalococcoidia bacterium]
MSNSRIIHLVDVRGIGGLQTSVRELGLAQERQGYEVHIMMPPWVPEVKQEECFTELPVHPWNPDVVVDFGIIHTHGNAGFANGRWRRLPHRPAVVHTQHGTIFGIQLALRWFPNFLGWNGLSPLRQMWTDARSGRGAHYVIAVSPKALRELRRFYLYRKSNVGIIPSGYSPNSWLGQSKDALRRRLGLPENGFLFLFVGRPDPVKDREGIVRAFGKVRREHDDVGLVVAPRQEVEEEGILAVEVPPEEASILYHACDVLVNASRYEAYSLAIHEALANGIPVVHSDKAGNAAYTTHGSDALVIFRGGRVPVHEQLVRAMEALLDNPPLRRRLSENARRHFGPMTWDWVAGETEKAYREALAAA